MPRNGGSPIEAFVIRFAFILRRIGRSVPTQPPAIREHSKCHLVPAAIAGVIRNV